MPTIDAFQPDISSTVTATAITTAGNMTLPTRASNGANTVRIHNIGPNVAYIEISSATATISASMPIAVGVTEKFSCPPGITAISIITATGTATLYATIGRGI